MKKQILFIVVISTATLFSCSKEKNEMQQVSSNQVSKNSSAAERTVVDPLTVNLDGWFQFNGNLKDQTQNLSDGVPTTRGVIYTYDRNGIYHNAIRFDSSYGVKLSQVPQQTNASIAAWVKVDRPGPGLGREIVTAKISGLCLDKNQDQLGGSIKSPNYGWMGIAGGIVDSKWHHIVVTYDAQTLRFYKDGVLAASAPCGMSYSPHREDFCVGFWDNELFKGNVDDLRFYSRTLSATDVAALYKL